MADPDPRARGGSLAQKLDHLIRTVHPRGRGPYTLAEIVEGIEAVGGPKVSREYIHLLRLGKRDNPSIKVLEAIAAFFHVPPAYFFDDDEARRIQRALAVVETIRDSGARRIAARAAGLSPASQQSLEELADHLRELEGQPAVTAEPAPPEQDEARIFTARANRLFALRCERDERDYSDREFAGLIRKETGANVKPTWVGEIRAGKLTKVTPEHVSILASFFGAPPEYFTDLDEQAAKQVEAQWSLVAEMKKGGIQSVAALGAFLESDRPGYGGGMSAETLTAITQMLKDAREGRTSGGETDPGPAPPAKG